MEGKKALYMIYKRGKIYGKKPVSVKSIVSLFSNIIATFTTTVELISHLSYSNGPFLTYGY